jgi:hypothetical protein
MLKMKKGLCFFALALGVLAVSSITFAQDVSFHRMAAMAEQRGVTNAVSLFQHFFKMGESVRREGAVENVYDHGYTPFKQIYLNVKFKTADIHTFQYISRPEIKPYVHAWINGYDFILVTDNSGNVEKLVIQYYEEKPMVEFLLEQNVKVWLNRLNVKIMAWVKAYGNKLFNEEIGYHSFGVLLPGDSQPFRHPDHVSNILDEPGSLFH